MSTHIAASALLQAALRRRIISTKEALSLRHVLAGTYASTQAVHNRLALLPGQISPQTAQELIALLPTTAVSAVEHYQHLARLGKNAVCETWLAQGPDGLMVLQHFSPHLCASFTAERNEKLLRREGRYFIPYRAWLRDLAGAPVLIQDYRQGRDASERQLIKGEASETRALILMRHAAKGLAELHQAGITHGALHPRHILLDSDGRAALTHYGFAVDEQRQRPEWSPEKIGTLDFSAPELCADHSETAGELSAAVDIYALGCIGYWLMSGHAPFSGTPETMRMQHRVAARPDVRDHAPGISEITAKTLLKAMQIDPQARYVSAQAFIHSLERNLALLQRPTKDTEKVPRNPVHPRTPLTFTEP
jgi:serine/threonine protein kinase